MLTSTHRSLPSFLGHFNVCLLQTLIFNKRKRNWLEGGQGEEEEKEMRKEKMGEEVWRKVGREKWEREKEGKMEEEGKRKEKMGEEEERKEKMKEESKRKNMRKEGEETDRWK